MFTNGKISKELGVRYTVYLDYNDIELKGVVFNREYMYNKLKTGTE